MANDIADYLTHIGNLKDVVLEEIRNLRKVTPKNQPIKLEYRYSAACKFGISKETFFDLMTRLQEEGFVKGLEFIYHAKLVESMEPAGAFMELKKVPRIEKSAESVTFFLGEEFNGLCENWVMEQMANRIPDHEKLRAHLYFEENTLYENFMGHVLEIKKFQSYCKNMAVTKFLVNHPNTMLTKEDFNGNSGNEQLKLDNADRIDTLVDNTFRHSPWRYRVFQVYFRCGTNHGMCRSLICCFDRLVLPQPIREDQNPLANNFTKD
jgi:DNA-binding Lrp family transcriptional regulator